MSERRSLGRLAREPLYNTKAVAQTTGVPADTIRAWERRYGFPHPFRSTSNQRLYSERDIGVIGWLRDRTQEGMTISQALQRLRLENPEAFDDPPAPPSVPADEPPRDPQAERVLRRLLDAVAVFDSQTADHAIDEALALFSIEAFCARVVEPAMEEIGERGGDDDLSDAIAQFATRLIARRLSPIFTQVLPAIGRGTIVVACPPGAAHEVGSLTLAICLCLRGWSVVYLGASLSAAGLVAASRSVRPDLVCLSAATADAAQQATGLVRALRSEVSPAPLVALAGTAFATLGPLPVEIGAHHLTGAAAETADQITDLIEARRGDSNGYRS
ncbi:MAG: MerR family transcriptional regulator [Thermomicrobiales bacterium]